MFKSKVKSMANASTGIIWKWKSFGGGIHDISVNSYDDFAAIGNGGTVYSWDRGLHRWRQVVGNRKGASAITLLANNEIFICRGKIIERFIPSPKDRFHGKWIRIPGCCKDLDSNGFHLLAAIGCDKHPAGFGIWQNLGGNYRSWKRILGAGINIALGSQGHVVVRNSHKQIFWKRNYKTKWIKTPGAALDVTVSVGGRMVVIGTDHHVYFGKHFGSRPQWVKNNGMGYRISCWSWRNPYVVGMNRRAYKALK